jgi:hypothetical protein
MFGLENTMTMRSDQFLEALHTILRECFPFGRAQEFQVALPIPGYPVRVRYTNVTRGASGHEVLSDALFLERIAGLFSPNEPGARWLEEAEVIWRPAQGFGIYAPEDAETEPAAARALGAFNRQPVLCFTVHERWKQVETVQYQDGLLFRGTRSPLLAHVKTLKKQEELRRFFHLLSSFQGEMKMWRVYFFKTTVTLRAPSREAACLLVYACLNGRKAFKSDTYAKELGYRVYCSPIETEAEIAAYQAAWQALAI